MRRHYIRAGEKTKLKVNLPVYDGVVIDMFEPEYFEFVTLRIKRFLLDDMLEQFGMYVSVREDTENAESIIVRIKVGISSGFYRWAMRYAENMEILEPYNIRENFKEKLKKISEIYKKIVQLYSF